MMLELTGKDILALTNESKAESLLTDKLKELRKELLNHGA